MTFDQRNYLSINTFSSALLSGHYLTLTLDIMRIPTLLSSGLLAVTVLLFGGCHPYFDEFIQDLGEDGPATPEEVVINQAALFPEGVEYDRLGRRFLVSSITRGTIGAVDAHGHYEAFIEDDDFVSTIGIEVDELRQRLLVCVSAPGAGDVAALGSYDLRTGERQFFVDLAAVADDGAPHFANDVAVDRHGNAYVTDSFSPIVYKVDPQGEASVLLRDEEFQISAPGAFGLNGIVYHPRGYLIAAFSETATLYRVPLENPEHFAAIDTEEGAVTSPDGLYLDDNRTLVVVNNAGGGEDANVAKLSSRDHWESAHLQATFATGPVFPTTVAPRGRRFYVLYAHLNELFSGDTSRDEFRIVQVDFEKEPDS